MTTPQFDGEESFIAYPPLTNIHDDLRVELEFKPQERDGLMFFCGGKKMKVEDFVAISMVDGHLEFRYELGTGKLYNHHYAILSCVNALCQLAWLNTAEGMDLYNTGKNKRPLLSSPV